MVDKDNMDSKITEKKERLGLKKEEKILKASKKTSEEKFKKDKKDKKIF